MVKTMYEKYWDLACRPFDNHTSPAFFFHSDTHEAARLKLRYVVESGLGMGVLCGGIGTGKTAVASLLHHELGEAFGPLVHIVFPQMPAAEFMAYLAAKLGAGEGGREFGGGMDWTLERIEGQLHAFAQRGRRPTIVIDEAHLIDDMRVFECLLLLLNFQQDAGCLFSLLLAGATNLLGRLERMPQLNERIAVRSVLEPLSREDTVRYVIHRLLAAGAKREIFNRAALDALCDRSVGIPRRINRLADLALLVGYADQLRTIGADEIESVSEELPPAIAA
jgi:MSHA biogenesis protein MshM